MFYRALDIGRFEFAEYEAGLCRKGSEEISFGQHSVLQQNFAQATAGRLSLQGVVDQATFDQTQANQHFADQAAGGLIRFAIRVGVFGLSPA